MYLILGDPGDPMVPWVHEGLARRGVGPLAVATSADLVLGTRWAHTLGTNGAGFAAELPNGTVIQSDELAGVVNRMSYVAPQLLVGIAEADRSYVAQEQFAMLLSALSCVEAPVFNPPSPQGLSGPWRHPSGWLPLAAAAGFATRPYSESSATPPDPQFTAPQGAPAAIVIGDVVVGDVPDGVAAACRELSRLVACPMLGVELDGDGMFVTATSLPYLPHGGEAALDALAAALRNGGAG